ncbi:hypothetical protein BCV70DRAFT_197590 [Testicularia cyperi]|uniref:Uncharacterized protein n=1 Tax=Testicularia cyperi TaxID=1882483 RepID=A0A317XZ21_9BASI|nr:hypothetical protein BCV70DRAFT_197590 [Testicularia cyperi]
MQPSCEGEGGLSPLPSQSTPTSSLQTRPRTGDRVVHPTSESLSAASTPSSSSLAAQSIQNAGIFGRAGHLGLADTFPTPPWSSEIPSTAGLLAPPPPHFSQAPALAPEAPLLWSNQTQPHARQAFMRAYSDDQLRRTRDRFAHLPSEGSFVSPTTSAVSAYQQQPMGPVEPPLHRRLDHAIAQYHDALPNVTTQSGPSAEAGPQRHSFAGEFYARQGYSDVAHPHPPLQTRQSQAYDSAGVALSGFASPSQSSLSDIDGTANRGNIPILDMSASHLAGELPPPGYHTHHFPPTPPALDLGTNRESPFVASFNQHLALYEESSQLGDDSPPPPPPPLISKGDDTARHAAAEAAAGGFGARFPRWRGWLEKRALERHYARMDAAAAAAASDDPTNLSGQMARAMPNRKKSWGAWINDPDALSDEDDTAAMHEIDDDTISDPSGLPPIHVHHYGSRFIPHLRAQPLCSILIEVPPPPASATSHNRLRHFDYSRSRQILLIGTSDGLFAFYRRRKRRKAGQESADTELDQQRPETSASGSATEGTWNQDVRCLPIWTGLGVYQMCILASKESATSSTPFLHTRPDGHTSGIFLALTCPSTAKNGVLTSTLMQLSAHAGSILESVASSNGLPSSLSSSGHGPSNMFGVDASEGVAAANFGPAAGGGPGRAVPPGGSGTVRMWNLHAIRKLVLYALDHESPCLPLDLLGDKASTREKKNKFGNMFKRTFASKEKAGKGKASSSADRRALSDGMGGTISPVFFDTEPIPGIISASSTSRTLLTGEIQHSDDGHHSNLSSERLSSSRRSSFQTTAQSADRRSTESPFHSPVRDAAEAHSHTPHDQALSSAMALALSSVPIKAPVQGQNGANSSNASFASLFADDLYQSFSVKQSQNKGKDRDSGSAGSSKGVLFFSVHEAATDTKGSGTWYLALATARSVMIYEASPPKRGSSRSWSWVKEFYAPFPVKAIAFAPASVADPMDSYPNLASLASVSGSTKLKVATADGPLTASRKGSVISQTGSRKATSGVHAVDSGVLRPYHPVGGAAPSSWRRADLCIFLSFGRRAVVVRLGDSNVREFELKPLAEVTAAVSPTGTEAPSNLSLQGNGLVPSNSTSEGHASALDRVRPQSTSGIQALSSHSSSASGLGHSRHASVEQKIKDVIQEKRSNKHNWVGFSSVQAQIRVRQHQTELESGPVAGGSPPPMVSHNPKELRYAPSGRSLLKSPTASASSLSPLHLNKELPKTPAPQNASFDRRQSRLNMDPESLRAYEAVQAEESSSGSEDESPPVSRGQPLRKYALMDRGPLPRGTKAADTTGSVGGRFSRFRSKKKTSADYFQGTELISARFALVSRGSVTHVLPLPLPADLARPSPLAVIQWSDTPNAVSGWIRVLGVERARSTGATSLDHFRDSSGMSTAPSAPILLSPAPSSQPHLRPPLSSYPSSDSVLQHADGRKKNNRLGLHVSVTCIAFLASRIEVRKVSFKAPIDVDFDLSRHAELELVPATLLPQEAASGPGKPAVQSSRPSARSRNSIFSSSSISTIRTKATMTATAPSPPADDVHAGLRDGTEPPDDADADDADADAHTQELEYLCGPLLTLNPIDLDATACGAQSMVLPLATDDAAATSWLSDPLFPELAGDGGIVAFDWRGGQDFRLFSVGAQG